MAEMARRFRDQTLSPLDVAEATFQRIDELEPLLHAFMSETRESARAEAVRAARELAAGIDRGPLHGIPVTVKDQFATRGVPTTLASPIFADHVPRADAHVVRRLRESGAVILGKANMWELASGWGTWGHYPLAAIPWDPAHTPGGSSSGSACAVAVGIGVISVASDGGGSTRVPANYCGVVGLKPTHGRISRRGMIPEQPRGPAPGDSPVSAVGIVARRVGDAAIALGQLAGYDRRDPESQDAPVPDYESLLIDDLTGLRVAVPRTYVERDCSPDNLTAFDAALDILRDAGASVTDVASPSRLDDVARAWTTIAYVEWARAFSEMLDEDASRFGPELRQRIEHGLAVPDHELRRAIESRVALRDQFAELLETCDVIATPTAPAGPPTMDELTSLAMDLDRVGELARFTRPYNLAGLPAITVPDGFTTPGLPLGLQLAGRWLEEGTVLRAAFAFESRTTWHLAWPSVVTRTNEHAGSHGTSSA